MQSLNGQIITRRSKVDGFMTDADSISKTITPETEQYKVKLSQTQRSSSNSSRRSARWLPMHLRRRRQNTRTSRRFVSAALQAKVHAGGVPPQIPQAK
eukprot:2148285-Pyramimonas_sp.AAC.1